MGLDSCWTNSRKEKGMPITIEELKQEILYTKEKIEAYLSQLEAVYNKRA